MIKVLAPIQTNINFKEDPSDAKKSKNESHIVSNDLKTRAKLATQKTMSAFVDYPAKGLKGDVNANFYEFLTMGIVPYVLGSAVFMAVFGLSNKTGKKLSLGVLLCAAMKMLSKNLVTKPVKTFTGVDTEMPYQNKVYNLPKYAGENAEVDVRWQQRKVFDSKEFFRKDLLEDEFFDKVAIRLGMDDNLPDTKAATTPIIQNVIATTNTAKSIASSCWAAVGVGLAMQDSWLDFFDAIKNRKRFVGNEQKNSLGKFGGKIKNFGENSLTITKEFFKSFGRSWKQLWNGNPASSGLKRHAGKSLLMLSILTTLGLTGNVIYKAHNMAKDKNLKTIDETKESTVI